METWNGDELWRVSVSQLSVRDPAAEVCRTLWTDLSQVIWDDHFTVPGLHLLLWMLSCLCKFSFWWLGFSLQNFHKQFKEIAAVMEMVWQLKHIGANTMVCWQFKMIKALYSLMLHFLSHSNSGCTLNCAVIRFTEQKSNKIVWQHNTPELVLIKH